jgi:UDP-2,4-diacetamido-2,4,6-trideoxy-beta-L-altropyranose hydrolase
LLSKSASEKPVTGKKPKLAYSEWLGVNWGKDAEETGAILSVLKPDWLVVDHYGLDANWEIEMASAVDKIMVIDDLADRRHVCSLLLDQNLGRKQTDYDRWVIGSSIRLVGPEYALLRPEFIEMRPKSLSRRCNAELKRILVSLGGMDPTNATGAVLKALAHSDLPPETELDIIMGGSAPHLKEVQREAALLPFRSSVSVDVSNMAERMCLADLSIGAAGSTSWERCCLGLPTLLIVLADNQLPGAKALRSAGAAFLTESPEAIRDDLKKQLSHCVSKGRLYAMALNAAEVTAGKGASFAAQALERI